MKKLFIAAAALTAALLCGCGVFRGAVTTETAAPVYLDTAAPVIEFVPRTTSADGLPEYYLFDDNPEHLNAGFLADGSEPSSIAHFENLTPGIYTVFSYHHRGYSVDMQADLYYDAVFSSKGSGGDIRLLDLGIDQNWDWNQAWADFSGVPVAMPEFYRSYSCTCGNCGTDMPSAEDCPGVIRGETRMPRSIDGLNTVRHIDWPLFLSDAVGFIRSNDINHFRYGGWNEPMWMMLRFEVTGGSVTFDTVAYTDKAAAEDNFARIKHGAFDNEPQYKGMAKNAPYVTAAFSYEITDETESGPVPVTVRNSRVPEGGTIKDGVFATNVNTWREAQPIAAESDLMRLEYRDDTKAALYGANAAADDLWRFDAYHTKHYYDSGSTIAAYGAAVGEDFEPNSSILRLDYPKGTEECSNDFYSYNACNLGNFGVTSRYLVHLRNSGTRERIFSFTMKSIAGQVYRYSQTESLSGRVVKDDGGMYIMKKFDDDPREDPASTSDPKERVTSNELGDTLSFTAEPGREYDITIEVTTLTGCVAPMHNCFSVSD